MPARGPIPRACSVLALAGSIACAHSSRIPPAATAPTRSDPLKSLRSPTDAEVGDRGATAAARAADTGPLTLEGAVRFALAHDPRLASFRQQHEIAAAGTKIAKTYPYNPQFQGVVYYIRGAAPPLGDVVNPVITYNQITVPVEVRRQRHFRRQAAAAAMTRTDWEIAAQELASAVAAIRTYDALLYRKQKLALSEDVLDLNREFAEKVRALVERGSVSAGDLLLARADVADLAAQVGMNRTAVATARRDLQRAIGWTGGEPELDGTLDRVAPGGGARAWLDAALELRPDRHARRAAIDENRAAADLQRADRFGNPEVGVVYEYDQTRNNYVGGRLHLPIPIFNIRRGEIQQARARVDQARLESRRIDVEIRQDVELAAERLQEARAWIDGYRDDVLPTLEQTVADMAELLRTGQPGVDVLRVLDARRRLLRARDGYLDAMFGYSSALADLAQAVGDPTLAMGDEATDDADRDVGGDPSGSERAG